MKKPGLEVRIAVMVIATAVMAFFLYNFLKGNDVFSKERTFYTIYDNAQGLGPTNKVKLLGVTVGQVEEVKLLDDLNRVKVAYRIDPKIRIPDDSKVIIQPDLLGFSSPSLKLELGSSENLLTNGSEVPSGVPGGIQDQAKEIAEQLPETFKKLDAAIQSLDSLSTNANRLVSGDNAVNLERSFANLSTTLAKLNKTSDKLDGLIEDQAVKIDKITDNLLSISQNLMQSRAKLDNVLTSFEEVGDNMAALDIKKTLDNVDTAVLQLNEVLTKVNSGNGSLALLLNDAELYNNLSRTARDLDNLLLDFKYNPDRYVPDVSVFGKKNKDKKKKKNEEE